MQTPIVQEIRRAGCLGAGEVGGRGDGRNRTDAKGSAARKPVPRADARTRKPRVSSR
jgi:hypothetical protein